MSHRRSSVERRNTGVVAWVGIKLEQSGDEGQATNDRDSCWDDTINNDKCGCSIGPIPVPLSRRAPPYVSRGLHGGDGRAILMVALMFVVFRVSLRLSGLELVVQRRCKV